jgi:hypothetical protein
MDDAEEMEEEEEASNDSKDEVETEAATTEEEEEEEEEEDEEEEEETANDESSDEENDPWQRLLEKVIKNEPVPSDFDNEKGVEEPYFGRLIDGLKTKYEDQIQFANDLTESEVGMAITGTQEKLKRQEYNQIEARDAAWDRRKFLIKQKIDEHICDIIQAAKEEEKENPEEEEEMENPEEDEPSYNYNFG